MKREKWLIVGLGNPEGAYFNTWHNLGFVVAEGVATHLGVDFKKKGNMLIADCSVDGGVVYVQKPLTYMNRSGEAVVALKRKTGIKTGNIIVLVDELYLDKGKIRIVRGGGGGGHNGTRSITELVGSSEYIRIKIGIKPQREVASTSNYVLSRIPEDERAHISEAVQKATQATLEIVQGADLGAVQTKYNSKNEVKS